MKRIIQWFKTPPEKQTEMDVALAVLLGIVVGFSIVITIMMFQG